MVFEGEGDELDLAALSKASRVSPRTIRYYIHQGLLPSPGKRGRGARYDRALLDRLELIKLLQRDRWPLGKIAERMAQLDDEGVRRELEAPLELSLDDHAGSRFARVRSEDGPRYETRWSNWDRVRVTEDVEISVRAPVSANQRKRLDALLEAVRRVFETG